jgi:hypothetical protein
VDTGSQVTLIKAGMIQASIKPTLLNVEGISGSSIGICGSVNVYVNIAGIDYEAEVYLAEGIKYNILGNDFMHRQNCRVDLRQKILWVNKCQVPLLSMQELIECNVSASATEVHYNPDVFHNLKEKRWRQRLK